MIKLGQQLLTQIDSNDVLTRLRFRFIQLIALISLVVVGTFLLIQLIRGSMQANTLLTLVAIGLILLVIRRRLLTLSSIFVVVIPLLFTLFSTASIVNSSLAAIVTLIAAALLTDIRIYVLVNLAVFLKYIVFLVPLALAEGTSNPEWNQAFIITNGLLFISFTTRYFIYTAENAVKSSQRTTILLQASAEIGQELSSLLDVRQLFTRTVDLVRDRLGYYHVQIFMVDEDSDQANLVASTGEVGQRLMAQKHRLAVGSASVIGRATRFGEPVVARINQRDSIHKPNPLLPNTKAELAIPIVEGERIIGALDVQSLLPSAFQSEDVQALQTVSNLLASAIRNARLFEQQSKSVQEQQRLFLDSEANLREIQRLNQQLTKAGWADYTRQPDAQRGVTLRESRVVAETGWTDMLIQASQTHRPVVREANGAPAVVAVPVILRGEVIGAIEVEPSAEADQTTTVEMVEAVAQRLAISLDNARLFEEAQAATAQEQRINSIVTRYQSATSIDDLLRITLTELSQSLGAQQGAIRLGVVQGDADHD